MIRIGFSVFQVIIFLMMTGCYIEYKSSPKTPPSTTETPLPPEGTPADDAGEDDDNSTSTKVEIVKVSEHFTCLTHPRPFDGCDESGNCGQIVRQCVFESFQLLPETSTLQWFDVDIKWTASTGMKLEVLAQDTNSTQILESGSNQHYRFKIFGKGPIIVRDYDPSITKINDMVAVFDFTYSITPAVENETVNP